MFKSIFTVQIQNEITKIIQREISRNEYEHNETNGHLQKLRKDRVNEALKQYLLSLGFTTFHLKMGSTNECFFYDEKNSVVINIMKEGAFQGARTRTTHYLRDIARINDKPDEGQLYLFQNKVNIIELIYADSRLARLYNTLRNNSISNLYTIVFKHTGSVLNEVGFYQFKSDLSTINNSLAFPDELYDAVMETPNTSSLQGAPIPSRNLKLKLPAVGIGLNKTKLLNNHSINQINK